MSRRVNLLPLAARTSSVTVPITANSEYNDYEALHVVITVSGSTAFNLTPTIAGYDPTSGQSYTLLAGSTINTQGVTVLKVGPQYTAAANVGKDYLPSDVQITFTISGGIGTTFCAGASLI